MLIALGADCVEVERREIREYGERLHFRWHIWAAIYVLPFSVHVRIHEQAEALHHAVIGGPARNRGSNVFREARGLGGAEHR